MCIRDRRYSASGVAVGPEFRVPSLTGANQDYAHVASLSDGGFVITWQDYAGYDGSSYGVFAQRYDAAGVAQGGQFVLSTYTESTQFHEAVCAYSGGFAAVWSSVNPAAGGYHDIYLQRWNNDGTKAGAELLVSSTPGDPTSAQAGHQLSLIHICCSAPLVVAADIDLQQHAAAEGRAASLCRHHPFEAGGGAVRLFNERIVHADRAVLANEFIQALRERRHLLQILALNVSRHSRSYARRVQGLQPSRAGPVRRLSHSLDRKPPPPQVRCTRRPLGPGGVRRSGH